MAPTRMMMPPRFQIVADLIGIISLLFVIGLMLWIHFVPVLVTSSGAMSLTGSRLLSAGITIGASLITAIVGSRIQHGLMRRLETRLRSIGHVLETGNAKEVRTQITIEKLDTDWRGILRIDGILEKPRNITNFLVFLLCGLITTAIVTDLATSVTSKSVAYHPITPDASFGEYSSDQYRPCFGILPADTPLNETRSIYFWNYPNGTRFYAAQDGDCPVSYTMPLSANINYRHPTDFAYEIAGVGVSNNAIGAPVGTLTGDTLANLSDVYGVNLATTKQCVPVMVRNPVRCEKGGKIETSGDHGMSIQAADEVRGMPIASDTFNFSYVFENRWLSKDSTMLNRLWTASILDGQLWAANDSVAQPTGAIGPAVIVFGARNDPNATATTPFASYLAAMVNDTTPNVGTRGNETYTVTCTIDPRDVFEYRTVTLNLHGLGELQGSNLAQFLSGGEECTPVTPTISNKMFASAAIASYNFVYENTGGSGYFATLANLAGWQHQNISVSFPESQNALEDVLGLISGLGVARMLNDGGVVPDAVGYEAHGTVEVTRLGTESREALFLLIPPVGSLIILLTLFVLSFRPDWSPGGKDYADVPDAKRPQRYAAESIYELVNSRRRYEANTLPLTSGMVEKPGTPTSDGLSEPSMRGESMERPKMEATATVTEAQPESPQLPTTQP